MYNTKAAETKSENIFSKTNLIDTAARELNLPAAEKAAGRQTMTRGFRFGIALVLMTFVFQSFAAAQGSTVTGAFEGTVKDNLTSAPVRGAAIEIENEQTGVKYNLVTDSRGIFFQGGLLPGSYLISIFIVKYRPQRIRLQLKISKQNEVVPVPITLIPDNSVLAPPAGPAAIVDQTNNIRVEINTTDARRDGSFQQEEQIPGGPLPRRASNLPLGGATVTRSFDELALLLPGVAPPPQTIGDVAGPGVGPGVGSAGQFSVNGLRSRANNFTVDGSDNNDEDIGVRRQGFVALVPQPIESIQEYQVITLLAPAQFGRNIGAQVNVVSKQGGSSTHGTIYGFFNSDKLNARNFFDTTNGTDSFALTSRTGQPVLLDGSPLMMRNQSGGKDSFTFGQAGGTLGGAVVPKKLFYFLSGEYHKTNAVQEKSFAVPTVEQRGPFGTGATGIFQDPFNGTPLNLVVPTFYRSAAILSLFPFANNPNGVYGNNTFTQELPASTRGTVLSGRLDYNFAAAGRQQSLTSRYNFTDDKRNIPAVGDAIFATVLSKIQTHNLSMFLNSQITEASSEKQVTNEIRFSIGRSQLNFDEVRDTQFLIPSDRVSSTPFLLNSKFLFNYTLPNSLGAPNTGAVDYISLFKDLNGNSINETVERHVGPIGQVKLAGFSTLGTDVYNFPQDRKNYTYQFADQLTVRTGNHRYVFGIDTRQTNLISDLPRLSRPLVTFNGTPRLRPRQVNETCTNGSITRENITFCFPSINELNPIIRPEDLLGLGSASDFLMTFNVDRTDSKVDLRYYQLDFYFQDTYRINTKVSLSYGLRYEYNTPVTEADRLIENTFSDSRLNDVPELALFINGRSKLYEPDYNNFAPRIGLAYAPNLFGNNKVSVFRAGYGIFYDQILGAVINQSRNVFPTYLTVNYGGVYTGADRQLTLFNPANANSVFVRPGTLNIFNPNVNLARLIADDRVNFPNAINITLPARELPMPMAHHYSFTYEQQLNSVYTISIGYIGTLGQNLLRFETPNLGSGLTITPTNFVPILNENIYLPTSRGTVISPDRPTKNIGAVNLFSTTASSIYNSLQTQLRGRLTNQINFQVSYTYSKVEDDVSDVFDLAGTYALPQNSNELKAERGPANFDVRHRLAYNASFDIPRLQNNGVFLSWLTKGLQINSIGRFHTGQPFTVNSIVDVNLDGNLTDRLDNTNGLIITGDGRQPLQLVSNPFSLLAQFNTDGRIGRNSFRAGNVLEFDLSILKQWTFSGKRLLFRTDIFNVSNRANFGIPVRLLEAPGFGKATNTITPGRRIQFALKYEF